MPLEAGSRDIVVCDGGFHLLSFPDEQQQLVSKLHHVLADNGLFVVRLFTPPATAEAPGTVLQELLEGRIANLNILKLRLGMSLQNDSQCGVNLNTVWETLHRAAPDFARLASQIGWACEHLNAINTYRNSLLKYCFVSVEIVNELFSTNPSGFVMDSIHLPKYEMGDAAQP